jgi:drug/metabolite transporter (DMT)-like permease
MQKDRLAALFGLLLALLWGISFLSIKVALVQIPPMTMAVYRFVIACALLPAIARMTGERLRVRPADLPALAVGGLTGVTLYFYGENHGIALLSASESSLVVSFIPVLAVLAERVCQGTRLGARVYLGAALSTAGVILVAVRSAGTPSSRMGYLFMLLACAAWVLYGQVTRKVAGRYGLITVSFWQCLFGLAGCIPLALGESARWRVPGAAAVLNVVFLGVCCSAAGYWLYISTLKVLGSGRASVYLNLIPVVSVAAAALILGERLGLLQLLGGAVVVAGVFLATGPEAWFHPGRWGSRGADLQLGADPAPAP